jgi:hypothetical protein
VGQEDAVKTAAALAAGLLMGLIWMRSGRDPLYWLIALLVLLRASIAQGSVELWAAACRWVAAMPAAINRSRRECLGGGVDAVL